MNEEMLKRRKDLALPHAVRMLATVNPGMEVGQCVVEAQRLVEVYSERDKAKMEEAEKPSE